MKVIKIDKIDNTLPSKFINNEGLHVAVVNVQIATELLNISEYTTEGNNVLIPGEIQYVGVLAGIKVYVDPDLAWNNNIITLVENLEDYKND